MLIRVPQVLEPGRVASMREQLAAAAWVDGRLTAGPLAASVKRNRQLARDDALAESLGREILGALESNPSFVAAALPAQVVPPCFNRYEGGEAYGTHVDNAIHVAHDAVLVRSDLAVTLFLSAPQEYDGGELIVEDTYGTHALKLPAGDLVLYPAGSRHRVEPVTRGTRWAAFFWIQSMVRDEGCRSLLYELDGAIRGAAQGDPEAVGRLSAVYQNLVRRWADT